MYSTFTIDWNVTITNFIVFVLSTDLHGFIGALSIVKPNQAKTRHYFNIHFKISATDIVKIIVAHNNVHTLKSTRNQFVDHMRDYCPVTLNKVVKGRDAHFYNSYSSVTPATSVDFDINDADAIPLEQLGNEGLVLSIVGKLKLTSNVVHQTFFKDGKNRMEKMREALISDGTRSLKITFWGDYVDIMKEDILIQITNANTKLFHDDIVLGTTYSTGVCFLSTDIKADFPEVESTPRDEQPNSMFLCCPTIESIISDTFIMCRKCSKKIKLNPGTGIFSCSNCKREFLVKSLTDDPNTHQIVISFDLKTNTIACTATAFSDVLADFGLVVNQELPKLKSQILNLKHVDFTINKTNMIIEKMENHEDDSLDDE